MAICLPQIIHLFCPLASSPNVYYSHRGKVYIYGLPLADVEVLIVDVSGVKVAYYPVHLISLC